jgi:hypothetical protein
LCRNSRKGSNRARSTMIESIGEVGEGWSAHHFDHWTEDCEYYCPTWSLSPPAIKRVQRNAKGIAIHGRGEPLS